VVVGGVVEEDGGCGVVDVRVGGIGDGGVEGLKSEDARRKMQVKFQTNRGENR
jgi:hypothetical protein